MRSLSWTEKLLLLFTIVLGASLFFQLFYILPYLRRREVQHALERQQLVISSLGDALDFRIDTAIRHIIRVSQTQAVRTGSGEQHVDALQLPAGLEPLIRALSLLDASGNVLSSSTQDGPEPGSFAPTDPLVRVPIEAGKVYVAPARFLSESGAVVCTVAVPVSGTAQTPMARLAVAELLLNPLIADVAAYPLGMEQAVYLVESSGRVLAHSDMDALAPRAVSMALDYGEVPLVRTTLDQWQAQSAEYVLTNEALLGSSCPIETTGWVAVAETPKRVVLANMKRLAWQLLLIDVGLFAVSLAVYWLATQQIVSDRTQAEDTLWESSERFRTLFEECNDSVFILDLEGMIADVNSTACHMLGYARRDLIGRSVASLHPQQQLPIAEQALSSVGEGQSAIFESRLLRADGTPVDVEFSARVTGIQNGMIQALARDITERKQTQDQMRQAEKMQAIGQLAGGIAHDFNNLLMGILAEANMLKLEAEPESTTAETATAIEDAASRAAELTSQLLGFARRGKHQVVPVDLHRTIREAVGLLERTLGEQVRIELDLRAERATVKGDPVQMQQVVMNLAINARDAMPQGGALTLTTTTASVASSDLQAHPSLTPGDYLKLVVSDTGLGIQGEHLPHIFEPFFTTKEQGKGTGMGLATVYGIVENHGGTITAESKVAKGTHFTVLLPVVETEDATEPETPPRPAGPTPEPGKGHVLLVDDEAIVLRSVRRMLERLGYEATAAESGTEALNLYETRKEAIDLVLIDVGMPEMDGRECCRRLLEINPDVKVLLSSGYDLDEEARDLAASGIAGFVQKPYRMTTLDEAITAALSAEKQPN